MNSTIHQRFTDGISIITLKRPEVLNSFNAEMAQGLIDSLEFTKNDSATRCVILTGLGKGFSAGQDLGELDLTDKKNQRTQIGQALERYNTIVSLIREIPKPIICAVNGVAAGAGANIALAADFVLASENASFIQSFSNVGLIPDSGGTFFLPRLLGMAKATALIMLGEKIDAKKALELGLIHQVVQVDQLEKESMRLAEILVKKPTRSLGLSKLALNESFANSLSTQLDLEKKYQLLAADSNDYQEGVKAFLEKRPAKFNGT